MGIYDKAFVETTSSLQSPAPWGILRSTLFDDNIISLPETHQYPIPQPASDVWCDLPAQETQEVATASSTIPYHLDSTVVDLAIVAIPIPSYDNTLETPSIFNSGIQPAVDSTTFEPWSTTESQGRFRRRRRATKSSKHTCERCGLTFLTTTNYNRHNQSSKCSPRISKYCCQVLGCGKMYNRKDNRDKHEREKHGNGVGKMFEECDGFGQFYYQFPACLTRPTAKPFT
ncbi:hypothetical protein BDD12DRAFT_803392 [Trichophaea hybrida]|nr:hypothetical protein BDD12DRAFT_803392 [Trichophaea hybrida]